MKMSFISAHILKSCGIIPSTRNSEDLYKSLIRLEKNISFEIIAPKTYQYTLNKNITTGIDIKLVFYVKIGSVMTEIWNVYARTDEEIQLFMEIPLNGQVHRHLLWQLVGVDGINSKLSSWFVNWHIFCDLQRLLNVDKIGLLQFAKYLSLLIIAIPINRNKIEFQMPSPAQLM